MKKNKKFLIIVLIIGPIIGVFIFLSLQVEGDFFSDLELRPLITAYRAIQTRYIEEVKPSKLIGGAIKGMIESLEDPYSHWMDTEVYKQIEQEREGEFGGIGIRITIKDEFLTVVSALEGTPASEAGIEPGDRIIKIYGESTEEFTLTEAMRRLRGKAGTEVKITIQRREEKNPLQFVIIRDAIKFPNIEERVLGEDIGYIKIVGFTNKNTAKELRKALIELKSLHIEALILDLRYNHGGLLPQAIEVADEFLSSGVIVYIKGRDPSQDEVHSAHRQGKGEEVPLVVLINEGSASASEIVAAAIKDNKRGTLLGEKTYGKGTVQLIIPIDREGAITLTTANYYTPSEICIEGKGIEPDIEVGIFHPSEKEEKVLTRLKESKTIEGFLIEHPYWEKADLANLKSKLEKEEIEVSEELLQRFLREEDKNEENDILNDLQLLEAIEVLCEKEDLADTRI